MRIVFENLSTSDFIQILSIIATTFISIVSITIAFITLRQNNKMIEESTRPYVVIYGVMTNFQQPIYKLIIKNFGQSGGIITTFNSNYDLINLTFGNDSRRPFENLENTFIAPGQSFVCPINYQKIIEEDISIINFEIKYKSESNDYHESIDLNVKSARGQLSIRSSTKNEELKIISYTLQDLVDKIL